MNTTENNKFIAEFMGGNFKLTHSIPNEETARVYNGIYSVDELQYHSDWNWLMPVVAKCFETGDNTDMWNMLFNALSFVKIDTLYEAVVEFVKWYNEQK